MAVAVGLHVQMVAYYLANSLLYAAENTAASRYRRQFAGNSSGPARKEWIWGGGASREVMFPAGVECIYHHTPPREVQKEVTALWITLGAQRARCRSGGAIEVFRIRGCITLGGCRGMVGKATTATVAAVPRWVQQRRGLQRERLSRGCGGSARCGV